MTGLRIALGFTAVNNLRQSYFIRTIGVRQCPDVWKFSGYLTSALL
jgi:hypothetical protein